MTLEATIAKMAFLLGLEITIEERNKLFTEDIKGELTDQD
jgi:hypothetical protein